MAISFKDNDPTVLGFSIFGAVVAACYAGLILLYVLTKMIDCCRFRCFGSGSLQGQLVVVTGASTGIGRGIVESFAKRGADVVLVSRQQQKLEEIAEGCKSNGAKGKLLCIRCDCSDGQAVSQMAEKILSECGCPHALVLCAAFGRWSYITAQGPDEVDKGIQAPCIAAAHAIRSFLPEMLKDKTTKRQILVPMSPVAFFTWPAATMYTANRWGLRGLCEALKQDLHGTHVSCCVCTFGETQTGYWDANPGSRQFVPWISRTGFIPMLSSAYCGERICMAFALRKKEICENFQISFLIECMHICPSVLEWCMRWFRSKNEDYLGPSAEPFLSKRQ